MIPQKLKKMFRKFDRCPRCRRDANPLRHILGGGKFSRPRFLFLFINPTHQNISCRAEYPGNRRFPFIGVRHFYRILSRAGFVDQAVIDRIYTEGWQLADERRVEKSLADHGVYITNLVKCTQPHSFYPEKTAIRQDLPLLLQEIAAVDPRYIVTFGQMPFRALTGRDIRLKEQLEDVQAGKYRPLRCPDIGGRARDILPCYFPVGRGNQRKALEMLLHINSRFGDRNARNNQAGRTKRKPRQ
jgi:hypothetical protein